ncbi:hypothetical protein S40293_01083 [Stachybotrys chartarum IBT 40293]|nr:hypothetical protein S40293_01083 [Stachybotrys chartarum IBT 40293]
MKPFYADPNSRAFIAVDSSPSPHASSGSSSSSSSGAIIVAAAAAAPSGRRGKKVRTGCITCKIRKVKCDETKPACVRCVKTGRKCDGYLPWSSRSARVSVCHAPSPTPELGTAAERHAFEYYRSRSGPLLGRAIDVDFWGGLVLKLSLREPVVRHAMLAMGSLHESLTVMQSEGRDVDRSFAFTEYGKAMVALRRWDPKNSTTAIPLLVCILFICIEYLLEHETASQLHISQGRHILYAMDDTRSPALDMIKQHLVPIYARLSLASFLYSNRPPPIPQHLRTVTEMPTHFGSVEEARNLLYHLLDEGLRFKVRATPVLYDPRTTAWDMQVLAAEQQRILATLARWHVAFSMLTATLPPGQPAYPDVQHLLHIFYHSSNIWIKTALEPQQVALDAYMPDFAAIVTHGSAFMNSLASGPATPVFTFETEVLAPVYFTVTKCRHPLLRRAALRLLMREEMRGRREGLWYCAETIVVGKRVIELEEEVSNALHMDDMYWTSSPTGSHHSHASFDRESRLRVMEAYEGELHVPMTHPPTIVASPLDVMDWSPEHSIAPPDSQPSWNPTFIPKRSRQPRDMTPKPLEVSTNLDDYDAQSLQYESPYGVPEERRIKNAIIGPRQDGGVWVTMFRESRDGKADWDVTREFLKLT